MSLPMLGMVDLTPVGAKIDDVIRLTGVLIEISIDEKNRRDFRSGVSKMELGIDNLRRLPGTAYAVSALSKELERVRRSTDPAEGAKAVGKLLKKLASAYTLAEQARKDEQKQAKERARERREASVDEIAYQSIHEEVQGLLSGLDRRTLVHAVPEISQQIGDARRARDAAAQLLAQGDTGAALKAIRQVLKDCQGIESAWTKRSKKMGKRYPKLMNRAESCYRDFSSTTVLSPEESQKLLTTLRLLVAPLLDEKKLDKKGVESIAEDIDVLDTEGHQLIEERQQSQKETQDFIGPILKKVRDLLVIALGREIASELLVAREAEKLLEQREYTEARARASDLGRAYPALEERLTTAYGDWQRSSKERSALNLEISGQQEALAGGFAFRHAPAGLMSACVQLEEGLMTTRSYTEANERFQNLKRQVEENASLLRDWEGMEPHRSREKERVEEQRSATQEALNQLSAKMLEAMKSREGAPESWTPHDVGGLAARLKRCVGAWETLCKTATTAEALSAEPTLTELRVIAQEAEQVGKDEGGLGRLVDADLRNAALARFAEIRDRLARDLPGWEIFPIPHAEAVRQTLDRCQRAITEASDASADEIHRIAEELEQGDRLGRGEAALTGGLLEQARRGLADRVEEVRAAIAEVQKAAEASTLLKSSAVAKVRQRCLLESQRLSEQVDAIAGRHASDVLEVFHQGTAVLGTLLTRCESLRELCKSGKEKDGEPVLPETFEKLVKVNRVRLEDKDLQKRRPSEHYMMTQKLDALEQRLGDGEHTTRLEVALQEWDRSYEEAMALVARDLREKTAFDELHRVVSGMLEEKASLFEGYESFLKKLKGDLKSAMTQSETEDGLRGADTTLRLAKASIERVVMASTEEGRGRGLDLSRELRQGEAAAKAGEERGKDQKAAWEQRVDVFEKRWLPKLSGLSGAGDVDQLVDIARKSAKQKPPDYDAANRYLQMAADRAQLTLQFPEGPVSVAITRLPKEAQNWSQAVTGFRTSLDALEQHFLTLEDPAKTALRKGLAELRLQFDPNAFTPIVQRICAQGADADTRARAREAALAYVRQYRDVMVKDARFRLLQKHPFTEAGAWKGHLILQRPLIELERLLLMAVPTA